MHGLDIVYVYYQYQCVISFSSWSRQNHALIIHIVEDMYSCKISLSETKIVSHPCFYFVVRVEIHRLISDSDERSK
jgi:hypothetical protein